MLLWEKILTEFTSSVEKFKDQIYIHFSKIKYLGTDLTRR